MVILTSEFEPEFEELSETVQDDLAGAMIVLRERGPLTARPLVDTLAGSKYSNMKELRFDSDGGAWRFAFAFDPERQAVVLCGGSKSGVTKDRFYKALIGLADKRFAPHQARLAVKAKKQKG